MHFDKMRIFNFFKYDKHKLTYVRKTFMPDWFQKGVILTIFIPCDRKNSEILMVHTKIFILYK